MQAGNIAGRVIYVATLLFFFFEYVRPGAYVPALDVLRLNAIIPMVCILGTLVIKSPVSNAQFLREPNTAIIGGLLGLLALSVLFATVTMTAYDVLTTVFAYSLIYWTLIRQIGDSRQLKGVFVTLTLVHIVIAGLNPTVFAEADSRIGINSGSFLGDGNDFSLSLNICIPLCLFLLLESQSKVSKVFWTAILLALVLCVVMTKSRGGTVALAAIGLYLWLKSRRKVQLAALFLVVLGFVVALAPPIYFERMATITDTEEGSAQGRIIAWKASGQMALANPILGAGAGHFPIEYGNKYRVEGTPWMTAHSIYFLLLGELGVPGLTVLLTFIIWNLAANRRLLREARKLPSDRATTAANLLACTSAALLAYATGGAFLSAAYYPHMYVLAGLLGAARHLVRQEIESATHAMAGSAALQAVPAPGPLSPYDISPEWKPRPALTGDTGSVSTEAAPAIGRAIRASRGAGV
jgi:probable O-glycosylation ligase (exosortase A-associated)